MTARRHNAGDPRKESETAEKPPLAVEGSRKALHLVALVVPLFMAVAGRSVSLMVLIPLSLLALTGDILRARVQAFRNFIEGFFGFMMRADERGPIGGPVRVNGATWVLLSAAVLSIIFPLAYAVPALASFMIGDAAAALVGIRFGRTKWGVGERTLEGSAAFVAVALPIIMLFPTITLTSGIVCVFAGAVAEIFPRPLNDNIRVPVVMATVLILLA